MALVFSLPHFTQFETFGVLGTATDKSGAVLPKLAITPTNQGTGIEIQDHFGRERQHDFCNVRIGSHSIPAELTGLDKYTQNVTVNVNVRSESMSSYK